MSISVKETDAAFLDHILYLRRLSGTGEEKKKIRGDIVKLAESWHAAYWDSSLSADDNALKLGVKRIRMLAPSDIYGRLYRAFYDADTGEIKIVSSEIETVMQAQEKTNQHFFSYGDIQNRLIAHEVFHCLENKNDIFMDELAVKQGGMNSPIWRDIGANAFANAACGFPCSQMVDFIWMTAYAPERLARAQKEYRDNGDGI